MEEPRYLCGAVDEWQRARTKALEENDLKFADMVWRINDNLYTDCKQFYTCSSFFCTLFETRVGSDGKQPVHQVLPKESTSTAVVVADDSCHQNHQQHHLPVYSLNEKLNIFKMIRVYCHTGQIVYTKGESILRTLERFAAFQYYGIETGKHVLKQLVL